MDVWLFCDQQHQQHQSALDGFWWQLFDCDLISSSDAHRSQQWIQTQWWFPKRICWIPGVNVQVNHVRLQWWQSVDLPNATRVTGHQMEELLSRQSGTDMVTGVTVMYCKDGWMEQIFREISPWISRLRVLYIPTGPYLLRIPMKMITLRIRFLPSKW